MDVYYLPPPTNRLDIPAAVFIEPLNIRVR